MRITRRAAERFLINQLTEAIKKGRIRRLDCDLRQRRFEPQRRELQAGMRKQIDADSDWPDLGGGLEYPAGNPGRMQRKPKRQAANAAAENDDVVHVSIPIALSGDFRR